MLAMEAVQANLDALEEESIQAALNGNPRRAWYLEQIAPKLVLA